MAAANTNITEGTRVRLTEDHDIGKAGEEGVVTGVDQRGRLAVKITNKPAPDCSSITKLLLGVPPEILSTDTRCG